MTRHGLKRLVAASRAAVDPAYHPSDSFLYTRIVEPNFMRKPGRTLHEDTIRMEALVRASDLDWTIARSAWLFVRETVGIHTDEDTPNLIRQIWREGIRKPQKQESRLVVARRSSAVLISTHTDETSRQLRLTGFRRHAADAARMARLVCALDGVRG